MMTGKARLGQEKKFRRIQRPAFQVVNILFRNEYNFTTAKFTNTIFTSQLRINIGD